MTVYWQMSNRFDKRALPIADRHYNRRKVGSPQFVPPASCLVLLADTTDALWVTSAPIAAYVRHAWAGAWVCSLFRREPTCPYRASELITQAVAITRWRYGAPPAEGFVTFVNADKVRSTNPGYCYLMAGWHRWGTTKGGLHALGLSAEELTMIEPVPPQGALL